MHSPADGIHQYSKQVHTNSKRRHNTKQPTGPSTTTNAKPPNRIPEPRNSNSKLQNPHVRAIQQKQKAKDEQRPESIRITETFPPTPVYEHNGVHKNQSNPGKKQKHQQKPKYDQSQHVVHPRKYSLNNKLGGGCAGSIAELPVIRANGLESTVIKY